MLDGNDRRPRLLIMVVAQWLCNLRMLPQRDVFIWYNRWW
jgi:hypothetical protein